MPRPITQGNSNDPRERERLLMQYAGIFRHQIKEFGETLAKRTTKARKNDAR